MHNITIFHLKIIIFIAVENCSILHRRVFVMKMFILQPTKRTKFPKEAVKEGMTTDSINRVKSQPFEN